MTRSRLTIVMLLIALAAPLALAADGPAMDAQVLEDRPDVATLVMAAAWELRSQTSDTPMITFSDAARQALRADGFDYAGFGAPRFVVMRFTESETNPAQTEVGAVIVVTDPLLRQASVSVLLTCTWSADGEHITVDSATANRVALDPTMTLTVIPADRVPKDLLTTKTHAELLPWILTNQATEKELNSGGADDCYLFAIVYDRLAPGDAVGLLVGDDPAGLAGQAGNTRDLDYNGWHIAAMRGTFEWIGDETFYVKVVHTRANDEASPEVIGILSSQLVPVDSAGRPVRSAWLAGLSAGTVRIIAAVLVGLGVLLALLGYKLGRAFLALLGLVVGAVAAMIAIDLFAMTQPLMMHVTLGLGVLIGALLFATIRWLALLLMGAAVGGVIGVAITGKPVNVLSPIVLGDAAFVAIVAPIARRLFTIFLSAAVGASFVAIGLGQWLGVLDIRTWRPSAVYPQCRGWTSGMFGTWLGGVGGQTLMLLIVAGAVFLVSVGFQAVTTRKRRAVEDDAPDEDGDADD